jgi:predicted anti-sigma-YlaC factor YlaD
MRCHDFKNTSFSYLQKEMNDSQAKAMENHLLECHSCAAYFAFVKQNWQHIQKEIKTEDDPYFYSRLKSKIENQSTQEQSGTFARVMRLGTLSFMIVFAIATGGILGNYGVQLLNTTAVENLSSSDELFSNDFDNTEFDLFNQ